MTLLDYSSDQPSFSLKCYSLFLGSKKPCKFSKKNEKDITESPTKKKRTRKRSECNSESLIKRAVLRTGKDMDRMESDSDDNSDGGGRSFKYNFCKEMGKFLENNLWLHSLYTSVQLQVTNITKRIKWALIELCRCDKKPQM